MNKKNFSGIKKLNFNQNLALSEIVLLIFGIVAFSYLLGGQISIVRGATETDVNEKSEDKGGGNDLSGMGLNTVFSTAITAAFRRNLSDATAGTTVTAPGSEGSVMSGSEGGFLKGLWKNFLNPEALTWKLVFSYSIIAFYFAFVITTLGVGIRTGDWSRALEAGTRAGLGAGLGSLAGSGIAALVGGPAGIIAAVGAALGTWLANKYLRRERDRQITFMCKPWQAQTGGSADCERCNNQLFPCTEYQCKSFGAACQLINKDTDDPRCVWVADKDVRPPQITPWEEVLTESYSYRPIVPAPGEGGVEIIYEGSNDGCLPAFQPFEFGIELDREGYCKIEFERTNNNFDDMRFDFGGRNTYHMNHNQQMTFPGVVHLEQEIGRNALNITVDSDIELYVRCMSVNGIKNIDEFLFKFCIDKGPDTTPPIIRGFNWQDRAPVAHFGEGESREVDVQVYVSEPSECRWDWEDKNYDSMNNELTCQSTMINFNAQLSYVCNGKLTGLENNKENNFYFRCKDQPNAPEEERNVNTESKRLTLIGTQPLYITELEPDTKTIKGATDVIKITIEAITSAGYKNGEATCFYSSTGASGSYVLFSTTDSHLHSTNLYLEEGSYNYFIRCIDLAGNSDTKEISFNVETDTFSPKIVRIYREGAHLRIITDEEAICVFNTASNIGCQYDFEDGITMTSTSNNKVHSTTWDPSKTFYIKCEDQFGNRPFPNQCSIIIRPFDV